MEKQKCIQQNFVEDGLGDPSLGIDRTSQEVGSSRGGVSLEVV
jgi:hypothetical protein